MNLIWQKEVKLNKKGFTLIELIVTIALLAILFSIVVPRINTDRYYMEKIAKELLYDLKDIKVKNMTSENKTYTITFFTDFYILKEGTNAGIKQYKKVELKEDYEFYYSNGNQNLTFNYRGSPSQAQTITFKNLKTEVIKQITIVPVTGRILLIEWGGYNDISRRF